MRSANGKHPDPHIAGVTRSHADEHGPAQPLMRTRRHLEHRRGAEIIGGGVDWLTGDQALHDLWRPVTQAAIDDGDQRAVIGLDRVTRLDLGDTVGTNDLPVRAARQHDAAKTRAAHDSAFNRNDPAAAERRRSQLPWRRDTGFNFEDEFQFRGDVPTSSLILSVTLYASIALSQRCNARMSLLLFGSGAAKQSRQHSFVLLIFLWVSFGRRQKFSLQLEVLNNLSCRFGESFFVDRSQVKKRFLIGFFVGCLSLGDVRRAVI